MKNILQIAISVGASKGKLLMDTCNRHLLVSKDIVRYAIFSIVHFLKDIIILGRHLLSKQGVPKSWNETAVPRNR